MASTTTIKRKNIWNMRQCRVTSRHQSFCGMQDVRKVMTNTHKPGSHTQPRTTRGTHDNSCCLAVSLVEYTPCGRYGMQHAPAPLVGEQTLPHARQPSLGVLQTVQCHQGVCQRHKTSTNHGISYAATHGTTHAPHAPALPLDGSVLSGGSPPKQSAHDSEVAHTNSPHLNNHDHAHIPTHASTIRYKHARNGLALKWLG
jgi:hypothetical protein